MKKIIIASILIIAVQFSFAKKVKFSVDMTGQTISPNGIHVMSDFQAIAGLGADFTPDGALMTKDVADTNIYYLYVDIPAFAKYEYKYVNGDQSYEVEVVAEKAQVGYNFVDNRWIYIDSLANDTTVLPAFLFSQSSAAGQTMMRYIVDMTLQTVSANGVHIAGDFQGWDPATTRLYSFGNSAYEIIVYGTQGSTYQYKFYNGNAVANVETVPGACAVTSNRQMILGADTIAAKVCFSACGTCYPAAVTDSKYEKDNQLYPNPMNEIAYIEFNDNSQLHHVLISDLSGRSILKYNDIKDSKLQIAGSQLTHGIYIVSILNEAGKKTTHKLSVE